MEEGNPVYGASDAISGYRESTSPGELTESIDDDCLLDAPLLPSHNLQSEIRPTFHAVPTISVTILLFLVQVAFVALTIVSGYFCYFENKEDICKNYTSPLNLQTVVIISKAVLWLLHVIYERFLHHYHSRARNRGYFKLYRSIQQSKDVPLMINSSGNVALLVIISAQELFTDTDLYLYFILGVLVLELILTLIFLLAYTVQICKFNRSKPAADIIEEQRVHSFQSHINPGIGFRKGSSLEDIIEKQCDEIGYLKRHNALLSQQLLTTMGQPSRDPSPTEM